mgnify:FL=1
MGNSATAASSDSPAPAGSRANVVPLRDGHADALVVMPARNEAAVVGTVVAGVRACGLDALVVDDHSGDDTAGVARAAGARVLRLPFHGGAWAAIQTGIRFALGRGYRYVVTFDADGQHLPGEIARLLDRAVSDNAPNVLIGSCPARANLRRRVAWRALHWLSGLAVEDLTSGFRVYDRDAMRLLAHAQHALFEYQDIGVLLCLRHQGLSIREVPVDMQPRQYGHSRVFRSWPMVAYYLIYSALIGGSRRRALAPDRKR